MISRFACDIADRLGWRAAALFLLVGITALCEGLAVAALLPLLREIGLGEAMSGTPDPVTSLVTALAADTGIEPDLPVLASVILVIVSVQVSVFLFTQYLSGKWQARYISSWLNDQFDSIIAARWELFETYNLPDAITSLTNDLLYKTGNALIHFVNLVAGALFVVTYAGLALLLDARLTLLLFAGGLVLVLILRPLSRYGERVGRQLVETDSALTTLIANYVSGIKVVKVFGLEQVAARDFGTLARDRERSYFHYIFDPGFSRAVIEFFGPFFMVAALVLGTAYLARDAVTIVIILAIFARLYPRVATMQQAGHSLRVLLPGFLEAKALNARARHYGEPRATTATTTRNAKPVSLRLEGLTAGYGDGAPALQDVDLTIDAGSFVVLTGPSGAGKTTLIDAVLGLLKPRSGRVVADGHALEDSDQAQWRNRIGYVDQDSLLFDDTIAGNIRAGDAAMSDEQIENAARMAAAHEFITALPDGYDYRVGERGKALSGGQRQRIAIARAFARRPALLLLDEATSGLDPDTENRVLDALKALSGATTILFATHRERPQDFATRVVRIAAGHIGERRQ